MKTSDLRISRSTTSSDLFLLHDDRWPGYNIGPGKFQTDRVTVEMIREIFKAVPDDDACLIFTFDFAVDEPDRNMPMGFTKVSGYAGCVDGYNLPLDLRHVFEMFGMSEYFTVKEPGKEDD